MRSADLRRVVSGSAPCEPPGAIDGKEGSRCSSGGGLVSRDRPPDELSSPLADPCIVERRVYPAPPAASPSARCYDNDYVHVTPGAGKSEFAPTLVVTVMCHFSVVQSTTCQGGRERRPTCREWPRRWVPEFTRWPAVSFACAGPCKRSIVDGRPPGRRRRQWCLEVRWHRSERIVVVSHSTLSLASPVRSRAGSGDLRADGDPIHQEVRPRHSTRSPGTRHPSGR